MTEEKDIVITRTYTVSDIRKALNIPNGPPMKFVLPTGSNTFNTRPGKMTFQVSDSHDVLIVTIREPYIEKK